MIKIQEVHRRRFSEQRARFLVGNGPIRNPMLLVEAAIVHLFYRNSQFKGLFTLDVLSLNMLNRVSKWGIFLY